jgi:hypothetical protein
LAKQHQVQRRSLCSHKSNNPLKKFMLVNSAGKVVCSSPLSGSASRDLGDGNLTAFQLQMESDRQISPDLTSILCRSTAGYQTVSIFDRGYSSERAAASGRSFRDSVRAASGGRTLLLFRSALATQC